MFLSQRAALKAAERVRRVSFAGSVGRGALLFSAVVGVGFGLGMGAERGAWGQELLRDEFSGSSLNTVIWGIGTWSLDRTRLGFTPQITGGLARLRFDTYNPNNPGGSFLGTEIWSLAQYDRGTGGEGLELEARVRVNVIPDGLVTSFFTYGARLQFNPPLADEIDFEHLSKQVNAAPAGSKPILLTTWNDYRTDGSNFGDPNVHSSVSVVASGLDLAQFNTYRIRWLGNRVEWFVNGRLMRTATQAVSTDPMNVRLNFWAPSSTWGDAYSASLMPATTPSGNRTYFYDADWVAVRRAYKPIAATGENRVLTDRFKNGSVTASDSVSGFWTQRNQGAVSVTETTADPLRLTVTGAGYPHAQIASGVRSELNFFKSPIRLTVDGIELRSTTNSLGKSILRFSFSPQGLGAGSESEYTVEDALSLRIQGDNVLALGFKLDAANANSEYSNVLVSTTLAGALRRFSLTLSPTTYTLLVERETSATDGARVTQTFTGALNVPLSAWRTGASVVATGDSAMFVQGQFNNSGAGEQMTAMLDGMSVDAVRSRWAVNAAGTWGSAGSWSSDGVPDFAGANAIFGNVITAPRTVTVDGAVAAGVMQFDSAQRYTLAGAGSVTLTTPAASAELRAVSGSHTVSVPVVLGSNTVASVGSGGVLTLAGVTSSNGSGLTMQGPGRLEATSVRVGALAVTGGTLRVLANGTAAGASVVTGVSVSGAGSLVDVTDNRLIVRDWNLAAIRALVASWWNGGARNGAGVGSSVATAVGMATVAVYPNATGSPTVGYFASYDGIALGAGDVIVRYAYLGDTNIDGVVDGRDLANAIEGFSLGLTGWQNGDFNYDGAVTAADLGLLIAARGAGLPALASGQGEITGAGVVPEPGSAGWVVLAGVMGLRRRR